MSMPMADSLPAYIVFRDSPLDQPFDAMAPLAFFPPKDSDELFDALRAQFPHLKTHSERMREATIAFLMQEQIEEQSPASMPTPQTANTALTSPWLDSFPSMSMSTDSSSFSSPDMLGLTTPSFGNSPQLQSAQPYTSRQPSAAATSSSTEPPAIEQMTSVFSLSQSPQPKQRVRRKMTEAEKADYRKRRIAKACDKCSKRKRKCVHNQPEMESLAKTSQKVEKVKPAGHHKKASIIPMSNSPDPAPSGPNLQPWIQGDDWLDFTLLEDPLPELSFEELLQNDLDKQGPLESQQYLRFQQPWGADEDFATMLKNDGSSLPILGVPTSGSATQQRSFSIDDVQQANHDFVPDDTLSQQQRYTHGTTAPRPRMNTTQQNGQNTQTPNGSNAIQQDLLSDYLQASGSRLGYTTGNKKYPVGVNPRSSESAATALTSSGNVAAPRRLLARNDQHPNVWSEQQQQLLDGGDRCIHQSESTSKSKSDQCLHGAIARTVRAYDPGRFGSSTELYRVRRGGLPSLSIPDRSRTEPQQQQEQQASQVNGGAYPRLDIAMRGQTAANAASRVNGGAYPRLDGTATRGQQASLTGLTAILPPTGRRATNPSLESLSNDPFQDGNSGASQSGSGTIAARPTAGGLSHSSRPRAHARLRLQTNADLQASGTATPIADSFYTERLHDTVRYRDHFGRLALLLIAVAASLLFCAAQTVAPTMLVLAVLTPFPQQQEVGPVSFMGNRSKASYRKTSTASGSTQGPRFRGWCMTPHSSLRWSVGCYAPKMGYHSLML